MVVGPSVKLPAATRTSSPTVSSAVSVQAVSMSERGPATAAARHIKPSIRAPEVSV